MAKTGKARKGKSRSAERCRHCIRLVNHIFAYKHSAAHMSQSFIIAARSREREVLDNDRPPLATVLDVYQRYNRHFRNAGFDGFYSLLPSPHTYGYQFEFGRRSQAVRNKAYLLGGRGITDAWFHTPRRGLIHALHRLRYWLVRARMKLAILGGYRHGFDWGDYYGSVMY